MSLSEGNAARVRWGEDSTRLIEVLEPGTVVELNIVLLNLLVVGNGEVRDTHNWQGSGQLRNDSPSEGHTMARVPDVENFAVNLRQVSLTIDEITSGRESDKTKLRHISQIISICEHRRGTYRFAGHEVDAVRSISKVASKSGQGEIRVETLGRLAENITSIGGDTVGIGQEAHELVGQVLSILLDQASSISWLSQSCSGRFSGSGRFGGSSEFSGHRGICYCNCGVGTDK